MNNAVFGKPMKKCKKHKYITQMNYLVSELNSRVVSWFSKNLLAIEMKKTKVVIKNTVY